VTRAAAIGYPSDLRDDQWKLVEPLIPPGKRGGDKRTVIMREIVNGLMYVLSTGCRRRAIPKDLPPRSTLYGYFDLWSSPRRGKNNGAGECGDRQALRSRKEICRPPEALGG
jgi:transposase